MSLTPDQARRCSADSGAVPRCAAWRTPHHRMLSVKEKPCNTGEAIVRWQGEQGLQHERGARATAVVQVEGGERLERRQPLEPPMHLADLESGEQRHRLEWVNVLTQGVGGYLLHAAVLAAVAAPLHVRRREGALPREVGVEHRHATAVHVVQHEALPAARPHAGLAQGLEVLADATLRRLLRQVEEGRPHALHVEAEEVPPHATEVERPPAARHLQQEGRLLRRQVGRPLDLWVGDLVEPRSVQRDADEPVAPQQPLPVAEVQPAAVVFHSILLFHAAALAPGLGTGGRVVEVRGAQQPPVVQRRHLGVILQRQHVRVVGRVQAGGVDPHATDAQRQPELIVQHECLLAVGPGRCPRG
eukprot:scaffold123582_cov63-Phaeocystis_antarctica.AAC.3